MKPEDKLIGDELKSIQDALRLLSKVVDIRRIVVHTSKEGMEKIVRVLQEQREEMETTIDLQYFNTVNLGTIEFKEI